MHRVILERHGYDLTGLNVDHQNHNGLDNRLINLRPATKSQNSQNRKKSLGLSKYKGVSWYSRDHKWEAYIGIDSHLIHLGHFDNEQSAAEAYNQAAIGLFGEFACLNNI
jgi:hypothetical protein